MATCIKLTDEKIQELAKGVATGHILPSWCIRRDEWPMVYMPTLFMNQDDIPTDTCAVLGDYDHVFPRSVNGLPMFSQIMFVNTEDAKAIHELACRIVNAMNLKPRHENKEPDNQEKLPL